MNILDVLIAPLYILLVYLFAFWLRPVVSNNVTRKYFIPGLTAKIIGGLAFGLIYQFYYGGGDTFEYYKQACILIDAIWEKPEVGIQLLLEKGGNYYPKTFDYASKMYWYRSPTEFFVIKIASVIGLFTFKSYAGITVIFATLSFTGMWAMYLTFVKLYPHLHKQFAIGVFFVPSLFFWGSGLMKDPICIGALGWLFWGFYQTFIEKKKVIMALIVVCIAVLTIKSVKSYILLSFMPPALFWIFNENSARIKNVMLRMIVKPVLICLGIVVAFIGMKYSSDNTRINLETIPQVTKVNADYLYWQSVRQGGSAYKLGELDGTYASMIKIAPQAILVSLFRPFIWEVRNPIMLLSSLEATVLALLTISLFYKTGFFNSVKVIISTPMLSFCFIFSLIFAFGVGINSNNFGTLVRYKIPFIPFYVAGLFIMQSYIKRKKKNVTLL